MTVKCVKPHPTFNRPPTHQCWDSLCVSARKRILLATSSFYLTEILTASSNLFFHVVVVVVVADDPGIHHTLHVDHHHPNRTRHYDGDGGAL